MKLGYPCINISIGCTANSTFRLYNYSEDNMKAKIENNLNCLKKILKFNVEKGLLFFRISSDLVPFASHPVCKFNWKNEFKDEFIKIGNFIKKNNMRISMHPDQFVVINSLKEDVVKRSTDELVYHCDALDTMELDNTAKVQIHVGGVYGDKKKSIKRFIDNYSRMPLKVKKRLVVENDEKSYSLKDCLLISEKIKIPVIFDSFHHSCLNHGENIKESLKSAEKTWKKEDGILMTDYSTQRRGKRAGVHAEHIDIKDFKKYLEKTEDIDFDIMLEIKDKEKSALQAADLIKGLE